MWERYDNKNDGFLERLCAHKLNAYCADICHSSLHLPYDLNAIPRFRSDFGLSSWRCSMAQLRATVTEQATRPVFLDCRTSVMMLCFPSALKILTNNTVLQIPVPLCGSDLRYIFSSTSSSPLLFFFFSSSSSSS
jgi:hypothetical protein